MIYSLKKQAHFDLVSKYGKKCKNNFFKCIVANLDTRLKKEIREVKNTNIYIGFKITKKIGNAVIRNKLKRRIRCILRIIAMKLTIKKIIVFIPFKGIETVLYNDLLKEMTSILILK